VGGIVRDGDRLLLVRRGQAPARGTWSVPGTDWSELGELAVG
jgi:ADP-ribose pyrophosphatase YjhB (NUDIX family)